MRKNATQNAAMESWKSEELPNDVRPNFDVCGTVFKGLFGHFDTEAETPDTSEKSEPKSNAAGPNKRKSILVVRLY